MAFQCMSRTAFLTKAVLIPAVRTPLLFHIQDVPDNLLLKKIFVRTVHPGTHIMIIPAHHGPDKPDRIFRHVFFCRNTGLISSFKINLRLRTVEPFAGTPPEHALLP